MSELGLAGILNDIDSDENIRITLAHSLDEACKTAESWHTVPAQLSGLEQVGEGLSDAITVVLTWPFQYALVWDRSNPGGMLDAFIPQLQVGDSYFPPSPGDLPRQLLHLWESLLQDVRHPAARSRLSDILFCAKHQPEVTAIAAIDGYLELSAVPWSRLDVAHGLLRAERLARGTGDRDRLDQVRNGMLREARSALEVREGPGVSLPLLEALTSSRSGFRTESKDLLRLALSTYNDPHIVDRVIALLLGLTLSNEEQTSLRQERVIVWLTAAEQATQMVRVMHLEKAVRLAEELGDDNLRDRARRGLQDAGRADLGLIRVSQGLELPRQDVEAYLQQFVGAPTWADALDGFIHHPPTTGTIAETQQLALAGDQAGPLQAVLPHVLIGGDGLPRWRPKSDAEREDSHLARYETLRFQISSGLLAMGLDRIAEHYSPIAKRQLVDYFASRQNVTKATPELMAEAFTSYWSGDYLRAFFSTVWHIEALARNLLLAANRGLYVTQRASRPGQYPGLSFLLAELLKIGLDESWYRYLWTIFASPAGLNIRNEVAHGFVTDVGAPLTAVTLHAVSYLTTITISTAD
jgi:hypothetical protein